MKHLLLAVLLLGTTVAWPAGRLPLTWVAETSQPVTVDGRLDEACWKQAVRVDSFVELYNNAKEAVPRTSIQLVSDGANLYLGVTAEEPDPGKVVAKSTPHDGWPADQDVIEIFLDPVLDGSLYYQFAANLLGDRYEGRRTDASWNGDWEARSTRQAHGWTMEIRIPFSTLALQPPESGSAWRVNICRDRAGGLQSASSWAPVGGDFHNPGKFNMVLFGGGRAWWKRQQVVLQAEGQRLAGVLKSCSPKETALEQRNARLAQALKKLSVEAGKQSMQTIPEFLPFYEKARQVQKQFADLSSEIEAVVALCTARTSR